MPKHRRTPKHKSPRTRFVQYMIDWFGMVWDEFIHTLRFMFGN